MPFVFEQEIEQPKERFVFEDPEPAFEDPRLYGIPEGAGEPISTITGKPLLTDFGKPKKADVPSGRFVFEEPEEADFIERVKSSWKTGVAQTELGQLRYRQLLGEDTDEINQQIADLKIGMPSPDKIKRGLPERAIKAAAEMLPIQVAGMKKGAKRGLKMGLGFAGVTAIAGQAGPQVALPEEIVTVPAAFAGGYGVGMLSGTLENIGQIEAGLAYDELLDFKDDKGNRVDPVIAKAAAASVGVINGLIEMAQIKLLLKTIPGGEALLRGSINKTLKKAVTSKTLKAIALKHAGRYGTFIAGETGQEVLQESTNILANEIAKDVTNELRGTDLPATTIQEIGNRLVDTAKQSALAFSVMGIPGTVVSGGIEAGKRKATEPTIPTTPETDQQTTLTNIKAALESGEITTDDVANYARSPEAQEDGIADDLNALIAEAKEIAKPPDVAPSAKDILTEGEDVTAKELLTGKALTDEERIEERAKTLEEAPKKPAEISAEAFERKITEEERVKAKAEIEPDLNKFFKRAKEIPITPKQKDLLRGLTKEQAQKIAVQWNEIWKAGTETAKQARITEAETFVRERPDLFNLVHGLLMVKPTPAEPKTDVALEPVGVEIPDFKTTGEAYAFGEKATPEQVKELQRLVKVQDTKFNELKKAGKLQEAMDEAIKHQFYNEALQKVEGTEQYKKFKPEPKEVPKTGTETEKVEVTPEKKEAWEMTPKEWTQESLQPTIEKMKIGETKVLPDKRIIVKSSQDLTYGETYISRSPVKTKMLDPSEIDQLPDKIKNFVERYEAGEKDLPPIYVSELMVNPKTGETFREIRDGHHRYYMAEEVGLEELPAMERVSGLYPEEHEAIVRNALKKGENVPENVLAEYPDLKPQPEGAKPQPPKIEKPKPKLPRTEDLEGEGIPEVALKTWKSEFAETYKKSEFSEPERWDEFKAFSKKEYAEGFPISEHFEGWMAKPKPKPKTEKVEVTKEDIEAFIKPLHHKYYLEGQNKGIAVEKLNAYGALQINKLVGSKLRANVDMDAVKQYLKEHPTKVEVTKKAGVEVTLEKKEDAKIEEDRFLYKQGLDDISVRMLEEANRKLDIDYKKTIEVSRKIAKLENEKLSQEHVAEAIQYAIDDFAVIGQVENSKQEVVDGKTIWRNSKGEWLDDAYLERVEEVLGVKPKEAKEAKPHKKPTKGIEDVGEKLGGARKDLARQIKSTIPDGDVASHTLSEIWPKPKLEDMDNSFESAFVFAARAEIPSKPRVKYKLQRWTDKVRLLRGFAEKILSGEIDEKAITDKLKSHPTLSDFIDKVEAIQKIDKNLWGNVTHAYILSDINIIGKDGKRVKGKAISVNGKPYTYIENIDEVIPTIEKDLKASADRAKKPMQFEVRGNDRTGYFINKKGDAEYRPLVKFDTAKEALEYKRTHADDLIEEWEKVKAKDNVHKTDVRNKINRARTGKDHRGGKDVGAEEFREAFGFRGVEFGLWVKQGKDAKDRQGMVNAAYDALLDLSGILGIPPKAISLNGDLGLGFGSRGHGAAAAHFEPDTFVINLTKPSGAGSLAHEWFHALDNYFQRERGTGKGREGSFITYRTETIYRNKKTGRELTARPFKLIRENREDWERVKGVRPEVEKSFADLVNALNESEMYKRSLKLTKGKSDYWSRIIERAARSFESYIIGEMNTVGYSNDYLANVKQIEDFEKSHERYPYLTSDELVPIKKAFDNLFKTLKTKETDKGVKLFATKAIKTQETITRKDLRRIFKRMKHIRTGQDSDGNLWFKAEGRPKITIFELDNITGHLNTSAGQIPVGSYLRDTIELKTGGEGHTADISTAYHELHHWLEKQQLLSANDITALNRVIAKARGISESNVTEEHRAYYVGDNISAWETQKHPRIRRILRKLTDFMNAIYDFAAQAGWVKGRERTAEGVLRDISSGEILAEKKIASERAGELIPAYQMAGTKAIGAPTGQLVKAQEMLSHIATSKPTPLETILNRIFAGSKFSFNIPKSHPTMKEGDSGIDIKAKPLGGRAIIGDASTFEISGDSATINVKSFGDLSKVQAFVKHGFDFMDIESKRVVIANMISASRELKVRKAIVESIPVGMMNNLRRQKLSPDMLLHDQSMLQSLFAINLKSSIPIGMDIARSIIVSETPSIAKISLVDFRRYSVKDSPATVAKDFQHDIPSHKVSVTIPASEEGVKSKVIAGKTMPYESQGIPEDQWIITKGKGTSFSVQEQKAFSVKGGKDYSAMFEKYRVKGVTPTEKTECAKKVAKDYAKDFTADYIKVLDRYETKLKAAETKLEKIKTAKEIFKRRRSFIKAAGDYFNLTDRELRQVSGKDIRLMSNFEFKQYIDGIRIKAEKFEVRRQAMNELVTQIRDKDLNVENLRKAMRLPTLKNMTVAQIQLLDETLAPFQKGDEFLTVRKLEVVDRTELKGIKTWREAREHLAKEISKQEGRTVTVEELQNIKVSEFDRFRYDTGLAEKDPFYRMIVEKPAKRMLVSEAQALKMEQEVFALAKKIKGKGFWGWAVPQHKNIARWMETPAEEKADIKLSSEETALTKYMTEKNLISMDYLIQMEAMRMGKQNYFTHVRRGILEAIKEDGIIKAVKEQFEAYKLDEQGFNILDRSTGEVLAMDKFFKFAMHRTGKLKPTQNVVKAFLTYQRTFLKKQALDETTPLIDIYAHALTPKGMTKKGLLLHGNLIKFVKEWINTQKGRHITLIAKQNGKIDAALRAIKMFTSLRDLGLNIPVSIATEVGEQITTYQLLGKGKYALGKLRQNTKQGKEIIEKYRNLIGKNPWKELAEPSKAIGDRLMEGIFVLFKDASVRSNKTFLLGSLSKAEFKTGVVSNERLATLRTELGRYRMVSGMKSIIGATPEGRAYTQYKRWAIPILRTTIQNLGNLGKKITLQKVDSKAFKKSAIELYRLVEITALVMLMFGMVRDEDDNSFTGKIINKAYREATTLIQALQPSMFLTAGRTASFVERLGVSLTLILQGEKYKTTDEYKGIKKLKRQFTPVAISQFTGETWDESWRKQKAKLNKIKDGLEKTKNKRDYRRKYRSELRKLRQVNELQGQLNDYRKRINRLKSMKEIPARKKRIQMLEVRRTELIKKFLSKN